MAIARIIADNILSPLGRTTEENYKAVKAGRSGLRRFSNICDTGFSGMASLFTEKEAEAFMIEGYTKFESLAISSIRQALSKCKEQIGDYNRTILIISTTKGNVGDGNILGIANAAEKIGEAVGLVANKPIVVSNACISGVSALILAQRLLAEGAYDYAVVCGAEVQCKFIAAGFQSLKALSSQGCRPFDMDRVGLNLGEAASTVILSADRKTLRRGSSDKDRENKEDIQSLGNWSILSGAVSNDGYHISTPDPDGEGCRRAMMAVIDDMDLERLALINAHATGTMYNDEMEGRAINGAGLSMIPTNGLKGYYGHTMGAAGILETVLTMRSLDDNTILRTLGFEELGVSKEINVVESNRHTTKSSFLKIISGFGGCNGALLVGKEGEKERLEGKKGRKGGVPNCRCLHSVIITPKEVKIDGVVKIEACKEDSECGGDFLSFLYHELGLNYRRFYKMDGLGRLGFLASEVLAGAEGERDFVGNDKRGIILFNQWGSLSADSFFAESMVAHGGFFPSPSLFVYTLPNIVAGEIAMRNSYWGETGFYILEGKDWSMMRRIASCSMFEGSMDSIICGWIEYLDNGNFEAELELLERV